VAACTETAPQQGAASLRCTDFSLTAATPRVPLAGEVPAWGIENKGPATVVIRTAGDPSFASEIRPGADDDPLTVFLGDAAYQYTLELVGGRGTAEVQICN
jgi:hypothetical protein